MDHVICFWTSSLETYGQMQDGLGIIFLHVVTFQRDMLDPATLGVQQVCPRRQGVDVRSRGGSDRCRRAAMVNA